MILEILTQDQMKILPLIKKFASEFSLVGGTAIALQIGHRRSVDFDLLSEKSVRHQRILNIILKNQYKIDTTLSQSIDELSLVVNGCRITFFTFPFQIKKEVDFEGIIFMPDLLDLSAMKAYALGRRSKWKDYVDLFYIFRDHLQLKEIVLRSKKIFGDAFNEKLFREQLCYFDDIDFSETIDYFQQDSKDDEIKRFLIDIAIS